MNTEELNRTLFSLTESEERHRAGVFYDNWEEMFDGDAHEDGTLRIVMAADNAESQRAAFAVPSRGEMVSGLFSTAGGSILMRRNSRFNPVPLHTHSYIEMSYVYAGTCVQKINGEAIELGEDEVLLLDTDCPHAIEAQGEGDIMVSFVLFDQSFLRDEVLESIAEGNALSRFLTDAFNEESDHRRYVRFSSRGNRRVRLFFQELMCETLDPSTNAEFISSELFRLIFAELINVYEKDYARRERESGRVPVIPIVHYIEEHYRTCTQEGVAEHFSISSKYVSVLLKKHTGMNFRQMIHAQRLGHAAQLLRTTHLPVTEVAREVGYENMTFFYKKFREAYGVAPAEYRRRIQG